MYKQLLVTSVHRRVKILIIPAKLLPVCDLLFNFVSVVTYFCDLAFDVLILKEAFDASDTETLVPLFAVMAASIILSQIVSMGW